MPSRSRKTAVRRRMPIKRTLPERVPVRPVSESILDAPDTTVVDLIDELLNKGVMASGDLTLGVAGIDLIYLRLSTLLCAADRVLPRDPAAPKRRSRHRQPAARRP
jgi:gas vesicle structural protein